MKLRNYKKHGLKKYVDPDTNMKVSEVKTLSFLRNRQSNNWIRLHLLNRRFKKACRWADCIIVPDEQTAFDVRRYYFIPKSKIVILPQTRESQH